MPPSPSRPTSKSDWAWANILVKALGKERKPQGEGWLTIAQIRQKFALGGRRAYIVIGKLTKSGQMEKFDGMQLINGKHRRQVWYRPTTLSGVKTP